MIGWWLLLSFAVATRLGWYRDGADVEARLPLLSTYLGHTDPRHTTGTSGGTGTHCDRSVIGPAEPHWFPNQERPLGQRRILAVVASRPVASGSARPC